MPAPRPRARRSASLFDAERCRNLADTGEEALDHRAESPVLQCDDPVGNRVRAQVKWQCPVGRMCQVQIYAPHIVIVLRYHRDLLQACLTIPPYSYADAQQMAHVAETTTPAAPDAELLYYQGALFADCGLKGAAIRMLQAAIDQNYCAYTNLQLDPMLRKIRLTPEFEKVLSSAKECQQSNLTTRTEMQGP